MKKRQFEAHMKAAYVYANLSYCKKRQVGCMIVKNNTPIAIGYNGTPPGCDNCCEDSDGNTKPNVKHAEINALDKLDWANTDLSDAVLICTTAPCPNCAVTICKTSIQHVVYDSEYTTSDGIDYLRAHGVQTSQIDQLLTESQY